MTDTFDTARDLVDELLEADELDALDELDEDDRRWLVAELAKRLSEWSFDVPGKRNEKALLAMELMKKVDWLAYGGAAGGAKSEMGLMHVHQMSMQVPGHPSLVLRTSKPELRRSLVFRSIARFRKLRVPAKLRNQENVLAWHYSNGSLIEFGYCARDEDVGQFLSAEYGTIWFDEATQFSVSQMLSIIGRCRITEDQKFDGAWEHVLFTTNPGSQSHMWFYEFFVQPTVEGDYIVVYDVSNGIDGAPIVQLWPAPKTAAEAAAMERIERTDDQLVVAFVQAFATDNPHLAKSYRRSLNVLPEVERRQKRDGDWHTFEGQFFDFDPVIHVVEPFDIPASWPRARAADWGFGAPWCCLWGAWDEDGNLHVYRELYAAGVLTEDQAKQAVAASVMIDGGVEQRERFTHSVADPSIWNANGMGSSTAGVWGRNGFHVTKANNHRGPGWNNVHAYLRVNEATGIPKLRIHRGACPNLIRTFPRMMRDKNDIEDLNTKLEDHALDALRYLAMIRPIAHRPPPRGTREGIEGLVDKMFERMRRDERLAKNRHRRN